MTSAFDTLTIALAREGVVATEGDIHALAASAQRAGVGLPLVEVMRDGDAPECVRVRAYGRLAGRVFALLGESHGQVVDQAAVGLAA